jgi:site-specific DNA recombinase
MVPMTDKLRVFIYSRYSSDMQNPMSIRDQNDLCERYASKKGWRVVESFHDSAMSGATDKRPGFQSMRAAISRRECDIVLTESLDRLSRDQEHVARLYKDVRFADADIYTLDSGKVGLIQIGFNATVGALFLELLSDKTRRGLSGRIKDGKSAGGLSYGYKVPRDDRDIPIVGELAIDDEEASIVRRIFREYAEGRSPMKIAAGLNDDRVPAPRGGGRSSGHWKQNTINGNRERGTGILNNELYIGRRVWNRLKYRKDPSTGRRVSRLNAESEWHITDVPALRIVDDAAWSATRDRQRRAEKIRSQRESHDANGLSASQSLRRRKFLLSGLLRCGLCGGNLTVAGAVDSKRYYCGNAKEKGKSVCVGMPGLPLRQAEDHVIDQLRDHLMNDAAYAAFQMSFQRKWTVDQRNAADIERVKDKTITRLEKERSGLLAAIKRGIAEDELLKELEQVGKALERAKVEREAARPMVVPLPDDLPDQYRAYVDDLVATLNDDGIVSRASDLLHDMIDNVVVRYDGAERTFDVEIDGNIVKMLTASNPASGGAYETAESSLKLVAGVGFEPTTFRL